MILINFAVEDPRSMKASSVVGIFPSALNDGL